MATHPADLLPLGRDGMVLRRSRPDDAAAMAAVVARNVEHLGAWLHWAHDPSATDPDAQRRRLEEMVVGWDLGVAFGYVLVTEADDAVVRGSFSLLDRREPGSLELGYWIDGELGGRGYARDAAQALTDAAFTMERIDRGLIYCDEENHRSAAIAERLGYHLDGVIIDPVTNPDPQRRAMLWSISREAWASSRRS